MRVIIDIEPGSMPIRGIVTVPDGDGPTAFEGWMDLTGLLEELRSREAPSSAAGQGSGWVPDAAGAPDGEGGPVDHGERS